MDDISDEQWMVISPLLPPERGRWARPADDNRRCLSGILWILRNGLPWREMPKKYGKWNSVYKRFHRWGEQGVWQALLEPLVRLRLTDDWEPLFESSTVKPRSQSGASNKPSTRDTLVEAARFRRAELGLNLFAKPEPRLDDRPKRRRQAAPLAGRKRASSSSKPSTKLPEEASAETDAAPKRPRRAAKRIAPRPDWDVLQDVNDPERVRRRFENLFRRTKPPRTRNLQEAKVDGKGVCIPDVAPVTEAVMCDKPVHGSSISDELPNPKGVHIPPEPTQQDKVLRDEQQVVRVEMLMLKGFTDIGQLCDMLKVEDRRRMERYIQRVHARWRVAGGTLPNLAQARRRSLAKIEDLHRQYSVRLQTLNGDRVREKLLVLDAMLKLEQWEENILGLNATAINKLNMQSTDSKEIMRLRPQKGLAAAAAKRLAGRKLLPGETKD